LITLLKLGVPITFRPYKLDVIEVKRGSERELLVVSILLDPISLKPHGIGLTPIGSTLSIKIGELEGSNININLSNLMMALGASNKLFSVYELDIWLQRISNISSLEDVPEFPDILKPLVEAGFRIRVLEKTCDYAIGVGDVIGSWINYCTGRVDLAFEEQESQGIYTWGGLKRVFMDWLERLKRLG